MEQERYPLGDGHAILVREDGWLRVEEHGDPRSADEMERYFGAIERALAVSGLRAMLIVAQKTGANPMAPHWKAIREARWRCLARSRAQKIAVLVDDELGVARVQMSAVANRAPVRAFVGETEAIAWLRA